MSPDAAAIHAYLEAVCKGPEHAIKLDALAARFGLSRRAVKLVTEELRENYIPVIGCDDGLFIPTCPDQAEVWYRRQMSQVKVMSIHLNQVKAALRNRFGDVQQLSWLTA
jgi:hypothetical protein